VGRMKVAIKVKEDARAVGEFAVKRRAEMEDKEAIRLVGIIQRNIIDKDWWEICPKVTNGDEMIKKFAEALQCLLQIAKRAGDIVGMEKEIDNIIHYKDYPACSKYMNLPVWDKERIAHLLSEWLKGGLK